MVTCAVEELGRRRPVCFAQTMLFSAEDALSLGDVTTAGVRLLEAARRYVQAMSLAYEVKPGRSLRRQTKQLLAAGGIDEGIRDWLIEIIDAGEKCTRCGKVKAELVETAISFLHLILVHSYEIDSPLREGGAL